MATKGKRSVPEKAKAEQKKRKVGRPSVMMQNIQVVICNLIAQDWSIRQIGELEDMPSARTIHEAIATNEDFRSRCARARDSQADYVVGSNAELEDRVLKGDVPPDVARVVISSRQWRASKLAPKKYGDKVSHEHAGPDGGPVQVGVVMIPAKQQ